MKTFAVGLCLLATTASAQGLFAPGSAQYPSPAGRQYFDKPVAECVIVRPCPFGDCVILQPCPPGTLVPPPQATTLPAPAPPPAAEKAVEKVVESREPLVIELRPVPCPVCEVPKGEAPKPAPKAAPKVAPGAKKPCSC